MEKSEGVCFTEGKSREGRIDFYCLRAIYVSAFSAEKNTTKAEISGVHGSLSVALEIGLMCFYLYYISRLLFESL